MGVLEEFNKYWSTDIINGKNRDLIFLAIKTGDYSLFSELDFKCNSELKLSEIINKLNNSNDKTRVNYLLSENLINIVLSEKSDLKKKLIILLTFELNEFSNEKEKIHFINILKQYFIKMNTFPLQKRIKCFLNLFIRKSNVLRNILQNKNNNLLFILILKKIK